MRTSIVQLMHAVLRVLKPRKKRKSLLDLRGKIEFAAGYDYETLRPAQRAGRTQPRAERSDALGSSS